MFVSTGSRTPDLKPLPWKMFIICYYNLRAQNSRVGYWYYLVGWWGEIKYRNISLWVQPVFCMLMNWDCLCTPVIGSVCSKLSEICLLTDIEDPSVPLEDVPTYCMSVTVSTRARHAFVVVCWRRRPTDLALYTSSIILKNNYSN
jgi:hypothetical protein